MKFIKTIHLFCSNIITLALRTRKVAYLFGSPYHSNMGDQAQTVCIKKWIKDNYPGYQIKIFKLTDCNRITFILLKFFLFKQDLLFCHSGYHITDLYGERFMYMSLAKKFKNFPITIFPQTINFKNLDELKKTATCFNEHGRITLMCRDEQSYDTAKKYFTRCHLLLYPDIVTSLIGTQSYDYPRKGVLFCMRNDKEAFYKPAAFQSLINKFKNINIEKTDTTLPIPAKNIYNQREAILQNLFVKYAHFELTITDRYHGTIFSLISGTPVIVLSSTDHKLSSGVKWFPSEIFGNVIRYASSLEDAYNLAQEMLNIKQNHRLTTYFKSNYYDKLKMKLETFYGNSV